MFCSRVWIHFLVSLKSVTKQNCWLKIGHGISEVIKQSAEGVIMSCYQIIVAVFFKVTIWIRREFCVSPLKGAWAGCSIFFDLVTIKTSFCQKVATIVNGTNVYEGCDVMSTKWVVTDRFFIGAIGMNSVIEAVITTIGSLIMATVDPIVAVSWLVVCSKFSVEHPGRSRCVFTAGVDNLYHSAVSNWETDIWRSTIEGWSSRVQTMALVD